MAPRSVDISARLDTLTQSVLDSIIDFDVESRENEEEVKVQKPHTGDDKSTIDDLDTKYQ